MSDISSWCGHSQGCDWRPNHCDVHVLEDQLVDTEAELIRSEAQVKVLREALGRYGVHDADCPVSRLGIAQYEPPCKCGFARVLTRTGITHSQSEGQDG